MSPWYASFSVMNFARVSPFCAQYWNAIFSAISVAVLPLSE